MNSGKKEQTQGRREEGKQSDKEGEKGKQEGRREGGLLGRWLQAAFVGRVMEEQRKSLCLD